MFGHSATPAEDGYFCMIPVLRVRPPLRRFGQRIVGHPFAATRFGDRLFKSPSLRTIKDLVFQRIGQILLFYPASFVSALPNELSFKYGGISSSRTSRAARFAASIAKMTELDFSASHT